MSLKASIVLSLLYLTSAFGSPTPPKARPIPLKRTPSPKVHDAQWREAHRHYVSQKYNGASSTTTPSTPSKRQVTATPGITYSPTGGAYYSSIEIGTPPAAYNIVLDTGSSDLWLASSATGGGQAAAAADPFGGGGGNPFGGAGGDPFGGGGGGQGQQTAPLYTPTGSSTFNSTGSQPFQITYLGGSTNGQTARETISMGGITVNRQIFGVATADSANTLPSETTGLMGLAWQPIAQLGEPWWQAAAAENAWAQPLFAFALTRDDNPTSAADINGGSFTIGETDSTQFKGDIEYHNIPNGEATWWLLPLTSITVNGQTYALNGALSAVDTGTTLLGGPQADADQIYSTIPGAQPGTGQNQGYYFYPCSQSMNVSISFGGADWPIDPADFTTQTQDPSTCMGALFAAESGTGAPTAGSGISPAWILGDTFLKNVYSVYRYSPPSVGFATLASSNSAGVSVSSSDVPLSVESVRPYTISATGTAGLPGFTSLPSRSAASPRMSSSVVAMAVGCLAGVVMILS